MFGSKRPHNQPHHNRNVKWTFPLQTLAEDDDANEDEFLITKVFEDVIILPMTWMGIEFQYPVSHRNHLDSFIEGLPTLITEKGVKLSNGIVTQNATGKFEAILANLSNDKVCLKRGMMVEQLTSMNKVTVTSLTPSPKPPAEKAVMSKTPPQDLDWNIGPNLSEDQREEMLTLLRKYRHVFATNAGELGNSSIAMQLIDTQGHAPIHILPRWTLPGVREIINKELD